MNDYYYELVLRPSEEFSLFEEFLNDILPIGYEEREGAFLVRTEENPETILWGVEQFAEALSKARGKTIDIQSSITKQKNSDWIATYQQSVSPVTVGRFYVHPTWEEQKEGYLNIAIDPALAFGTGHHPTTATCLEAISKYVQEGMEVCDVGCGSGILAIAASKLGAQVDGCDTDEVSVENSAKNCTLNGVELRNLWHGSIQQSDTRYDIVVANIVADVLIFLHDELAGALKNIDSLLILSGIMNKYEQKVLKRYADFITVDRITQEEWVTLVMKKRKETE